jgi:DNA polymerase III subunit epsilon
VMAEVPVDVEEVELENERGVKIDGVKITCGRCDHEVEVFGTSEASVKRGCAMLRDECPLGERNFYVGVAPDDRPRVIRLKKKPLKLSLVPMPEPPPRAELVLFFDTETTGLPRNYNAPATDFANWPRLVQIAWHLSAAPDDPGIARSYIIFPDGFEIPAEAAAVHGITTERARDEGKLLWDVLAEFAAYIDSAGVLAAHNITFDRGVVGAEFLRAGIENYCDGIAQVCTMQSSTNLCQIPRRGGRGFKFPKLGELHRVLFGCGFEGAHDAANDVAAGMRCYWELKNRGVL